MTKISPMAQAALDAFAKQAAQQGAGNDFA